MEVTFEQFQSWCKNKTAQLAEKTYFKDLSENSTSGGYERHFYFSIITKSGRGYINMFQSNGCYWVDFEAANFARLSEYVKSVDYGDLEDLNGLETYYNAFIEVIE